MPTSYTFSCCGRKEPGPEPPGMYRIFCPSYTHLCSGQFSCSASADMTSLRPASRIRQSPVGNANHTLLGLCILMIRLLNQESPLHAQGRQHYAGKSSVLPTRMMPS